MEILGRILDELSRSKLKFAKICQFKSKMTLKVKVDRPYFQEGSEGSQDPIFKRVLKDPKIHILCDNKDSMTNPWRVFAQTSSNLQKSVSLSPKWPWRSRSIDPIFNRVLKGPKIHIPCENGDSRSNPWWVIAQTSSNLRKSVSLSPKWPWRSRSIDPIFNRVLKGPKIHIQCEYWVSRSNPWRVIAQTSSSYRRTDRRTDRRSQRQYPFGKICRGVKTKWDVVDTSVLDGVHLQAD